VSRGAAEPYLNRLLRLPGFLIGEGEADVDAVRDAFALTGHFLDMHVWGPRQLDPPAVRDSLIEAVSPH
jgi:DNA repair protein RecO (recombination protein O)